MVKLSGTIIAFNEERKLARAIESMRCCDEIVVVDSGSTDGTRAVALGLGTRLIEQPWLGYARQKNFAADRATFDWILSLDADEVLSDSLDAEIWTLKNEGLRYDAYTMPRIAHYMGRWIRHGGWYPDRKVRLYDRRKARWVGEFVHESVQVNGSVRALDGNLLHFTCDSISEHMGSLDRYTTLAAREIIARHGPASLNNLVFGPVWTFLRTYLLQRGFLDGFQGFTIAWMAALYTFLKYAKAREGRR